MRYPMTRFAAAASAVLITASTASAGAKANKKKPRKPPADEGKLLEFHDASGTVGTFSRQNRPDSQNPFFRTLGSNGRACRTCHEPSDGWGLNLETIRSRFDASGGTDPLFQPHDAAVSPNADVSTIEARREAYRLLLTRGVFRSVVPMPDNADFELVSIEDPYGVSTPNGLSLYRRPLPATNLGLSRNLLWDDRVVKGFENRDDSLVRQALIAVQDHLEPRGTPGGSVLNEIVQFENGLVTTQMTDARAGRLDQNGGQGGPAILASQPFPNLDKVPVRFPPSSLELFQSWRGSGGDPTSVVGRRGAIARGQRLFGEIKFEVTGVNGFNGRIYAQSVMVNCASCHSTPGSATHAHGMMMDIGVSSAARRTADMPLYTFRLADGTTLATMDPGFGLVTGISRDVGRVRIPSLRGLSARAPYFHDGSARTLDDVVSFYVERFKIPFSQGDQEDLVAFLQSL
jgi:cytochrome c peroxidase